MALALMTPERIVTLRSVQGIDRAEDARISDSGSWYATINLWSKSTSGLLAKRPGSSCIIDGRDVERLTDTGADTTVPWTNNNGVLIPGPTTFTDGRINIVSTN